MVVEFIIGIILLFSIILNFCVQPRKPKNFPPGPFSWPIVGNLLQVGMEPYKNVMSLRKNYGDIIGLDLGMRRSVFINESKLLKEAFNIPAINGRCRMDHFSYLENGALRGVAFTSGQFWIEQRRFCYSYLQSGLRNGTEMENFILNEVKELVEIFDRTLGTPVDTSSVFNIPVINALWLIVAGERFSQDNPNHNKIVKHSKNISDSTKTQGLLAFFPSLGKILPQLSGYTKVRHDLMEINKSMQLVVDEHKRTYQEDIQRDFIDHYLKKINSTTDKNSTFYGKLGEENLVCNLEDFFLAGTDTISVALRWLIFLLAHHPQAQEKLAAEIKFHLDDQSWPTLQDKSRMPYVEAVFQEVLRFSAFVPMGLLHEALEDVQFNGYKIPKGTVIVPNLYGILHDSDYWGDAEAFRPERFLTEDETEVIRHGASVAFAVGRRICPGDSLAKDEIFLFIVGLFKYFKVEFDPSSAKPRLDYQKCHFLSPVEHKIVFHRRSTL